MATDNHRQTAVLFPDPQENFDHPGWQTVAELDTPPAPVPHSVRASTPQTLPNTDHSGPQPDTAVITDGDDPFVDDDHDAPADIPTSGNEFAASTAGTYLGEEVEADDVPVPRWVSAHIPADRLVTDEPNRRFRRRRPTAPPNADVDDAAPARTVAAERSRSIPVGWIAAGVLAAAAVIGAAVAVITDEQPAPPLAAPAPTQAPEAATTSASISTTAAAAPAPWCPASATVDATTTDAAGDTGSAVGVIAAFEHAYYVQRSGTAVAALMTSPAPADRIQAVIDRTPAGTEHCVTIAATDVPYVHAVALALRTPSGSESAIASRITTTRAGESYAIANVEEVR